MQKGLESMDSTSHFRITKEERQSFLLLVRPKNCKNGKTTSKKLQDEWHRQRNRNQVRHYIIDNHYDRTTINDPVFTDVGTSNVSKNGIIDSCVIEIEIPGRWDPPEVKTNCLGTTNNNNNRPGGNVTEKMPEPQVQYQQPQQV